MYRLALSVLQDVLLWQSSIGKLTIKLKLKNFEHMQKTTVQDNWVTLKIKRQLFFLLIIAIIPVSCERPPITMNRIQSIEREMDYDIFKSQVSRKATLSFSIQYNDISYLIELYPMQSGTKTVYTYVYTKYGGYATSISVPVSEDYAFIFCDNRLMFWGFLNECQKAEDKLVQQLAPLIVEQYQKSKTK